MTEAAPHAKRRIVIFADGTGNSFAAQESNIWRLYSALDKAEQPGDALQIAYYIPGVGTSANRILRAIDGATGIGVPSNVRKLYRFLSWNWHEGDEVFLFGFSRGAFTVRALAGMVRYQGLMPREIDGRRVTDAEMKRNSARAWEAYRRDTAPLWKKGLKMAPWIAAVRWLRDGLVSARRRLFGQKTHAEILKERPAILRPDLGAETPKGQEGGKVRIRYMGLFDTVEAYGFPFEGLRKFWSWWLWPITFRNRVCSRIVDRADQVLALDDERMTFHPIQFDQSEAGTDAAPTLIREAWFAGMHSDVGGGYPDDAVAMEPLLWVLQAAGAEGLRFAPGFAARFQERRYPRGLIHDSRAGLAATYRYAPRKKPAGQAFGGAPILHRSVLQKLKAGAGGYAPLLLPPDLRVCDGPDTHATAPAARMQGDADADAVVRRLVRWRRRLNRGLIGLVAVFLALPLVFGPGRPTLDRLWDRLCETVLAWWAVAGFKLAPLWEVYREIWPLALTVLLLGAVFWSLAGTVQGKIKDRALKVWKVEG